MLRKLKRRAAFSTQTRGNGAILSPPAYVTAWSVRAHIGQNCRAGANELLRARLYRQRGQFQPHGLLPVGISGLKSTLGR